MELAIPLLGRDCRPGGEGNRVRFFGTALWGPTFGELNIPPDTWTERDIRWRGRGCGLWRLTTYGVTAIGPSETAPLTEAQLLGQSPITPNLWEVHQRCLPIWVHLQIGPHGNDYYIDPGGTIEFWADGVDVGWVAPPTWVDLDKQAVPTTPSGNEYVGLLYGELRRIEAAIGPRRRTLTQTFFVALNTSQTLSQAGRLRIPRGATSVSISMDNLGVVAGGTWSFAMVPNFAVALPNILGSIQVGSPARVTAYTGGLVANATHIIAPSIAEDKIYTIVWEIEP